MKIMAKKKIKIKNTARKERFSSFKKTGWRWVLSLSIGLIALALFLSVVSYNAYDPSFHTLATSNQGGYHNWLGALGAYSADILIQSLGLGAILFILYLWVWSYLLSRDLGPRFSLRRMSCVLISVLGFCILFAPFLAESWRGYAGSWGGGTGVILYNLSTLANANLIGKPYGWAVQILGLLIFIIGLRFAITITFRDMGALLWRMVPKFKKNDDFEISDVEIATHDNDENNDHEPEIIVPSLPKSAEATATRKPNKKVPQKKLALDGEEPDYQNWVSPSSELLQKVPKQDSEPVDEKALQRNAQLLENVLSDFNVQGNISRVSPGPVVTLYDLEPAPGVKSSRVINLSDDIARSMSAVSVRAAVVPGKNVIGIELPNKKKQIVYMREMVESDTYKKTTAKLPLILGKDIGGAPVMADLSRMPHLLVAGTTGSGKSVAINTMITSILYKLSPAQCRFIMIDPKMLELSVYDGIPHLLSPVVTEPGKAVVALKWAVKEMEDRYRDMSKLGVRNIEGYNQRVKEARQKGEVIMRKIQTGFDAETGKPVYEELPLDLNELPFIVVIVDEFADLMLVAGKDVESAVQRLAQMARAAGIHMIMATQRPSVDVITGTIKANFPTRISFAVTSKIDSRTILGEGGAEQLLGHGDMLYMAAGGKVTRVHGPFCSDKDVEEVVNYLKSQGEPVYVEDVTDEGGDFDGMDGDGSDVDELYRDAVELILREEKASTSFIQRHLQIGYNRAARIIDEMEKRGVVSKANHVGKREILISSVGEAM